MFKMSSLYIASVKECIRLFTLVIGFLTIFAPLLPLTQTTVSAQSRDDFQTIETDQSKAATPAFEREYLPSNQDSTTSNISNRPDFFGTVESNGRGRGNGGGTPVPATNPQWTIAAASGVKISVNHEAWYRVSADQLEMAGFPVSSNRTYWQLFAEGQEQAIKINTDGSMEFYGKGLDTIQTDTRVYYLIYGQTAGKRLAVGGTNTSNSNNNSNFDITVERKSRIYYVPGILNGDNENWFGNFIQPSQPVYENLSINNPDITGTARLNVKLQGLAIGVHSVVVKFNDINLGSANFSNYQNMTFGFDIPMSAVVAGSNQVSLQSNASSSDYNLVDSVSLTYKRLYTAQDNRLHFNVPAKKGLRVSNFTENNISVFQLENGKVTNELAVNVQSDGGTYSFSVDAAKGVREMMAITNSRKESPLEVEANSPSAWNGSGNNADLLIIAPAVFAQHAQTVANMRIQQGLNARVVMTDDIYDEFSYGARSAQGIRDFIKHATIYWQVKPRYVLLFGDSSYDSRNYLGIANRDFVPTKLVDTAYYETASDSWLADFNDDTVEDIAIGRLPAGSDAEAAQMIEKLARYDAQGNRQMKKGVFVSDTLFSEYSQELANILPSTAQASVVNRQEMTDAQMQQEIFTRGSDNPLLVVYTGHGSTVGWTNANLLSNSNVGNLNNDLLGFYMVVGCLNGYSHDPYSDSLAEALLKSPNGAMGVFASSGSIVVSGPTAMSPVLTDKIFNSQPNDLMRIGDVVRLSKQSSLDADSKRTYQLFGDPTVYIK